jgi:hypothetical protein
MLRRTSMVVGLLLFGATSHASTILFDTDPFAGTDALTTPGRQIVGGLGTEFTFDISTDVFVFDVDVFGVEEIQFANDLTGNLPSSGFNVVVVQDGAPLAAGIAADRIAEQLATSGPGFFVYFNTGLDLPRLVFSTDLSDNTADLAILARLTNLAGPAGFAAMPTFTAANFATAAAVVPEPSTFLLLTTAAAAFVLLRRRRRPV